MSDVIQNVDYDLQSRTIVGDGLFVAASENFDPFLLDWQMKHPSVYRDRIPKGKFPNFSGMAQKSYIFRGSLGDQSGLTHWERVEQSRKETDSVRGLDACSYRPRTYDWSYDEQTFSGVKSSWRSPSICVGEMRYLTEAVAQLGMIIAAGAEVVDSSMETFNREQYMLTAANAGKFIALAEGVGLDYIDNTASRVTYDPYTSSSITISKAVYEKLSTLNFDMLDLVHQYLSDQCPDAASSNSGGMPIFMLTLDVRDFEKYVLNTPELREDFRRAIPERLIEGFAMGFKTYRGWAIAHDPRQARYGFSSINGADATATVTLARIDPRRATLAGIIGSIPTSNPAYVTAEFGTAIVFLNDTIQLLVPAPINSLGSGMSFGPQPDFNGTWTWLNIAEEKENPLQEKGYFFARFEYFVKPLRYAKEITVLLYRRCVAALKRDCGLVERSTRAADSTTVVNNVTVALGTFLAASGTVGGWALVNLAKPLSVGIGGQVSLTHDGGTTTMTVVEDHDAPTYKLAWAYNATAAPTDTQIDAGDAVAVV